MFLCKLAGIGLFQLKVDTLVQYINWRRFEEETWHQVQVSFLPLYPLSLTHIHTHFACHLGREGLGQKHTLGGRNGDCYSGIQRWMKCTRNGLGRRRPCRMWEQSEVGSSWIRLDTGLFKQEAITTREPRDLLRFDFKLCHCSWDPKWYFSVVSAKSKSWDEVSTLPCFIFNVST